jgi:inner membrane protein
LLFALLLAAGASAAAPLLRTSRRTSFFFVLVAAVSHPLLDMLTNGGLGVALFWPVSDLRYFAPWQVIEVSPLSLRRVFSERGLALLRSELAWVWVPCAVAAAIGMRIRRGNPAEIREKIAPEQLEIPRGR